MNDVSVYLGRQRGEGSLIVNYVFNFLSLILPASCVDMCSKLPGPFYHVNDVSVYLGRQRGARAPHRKNELEALPCCFCPIRWSFKLSQNNKNILLHVMIKNWMVGRPGNKPSNIPCE